MALTEAATVGWKMILAVTMAVSLNGNVDIASAAGCDDVGQYYSQASGLKGANLKAKLHAIVAGHKQLTYAQVVLEHFLLLVQKQSRSRASNSSARINMKENE